MENITIENILEEVKDSYPNKEAKAYADEKFHQNNGAYIWTNLDEEKWAGYYHDYIDISRKQKEKDIAKFKQYLDDEGCGPCQGGMDDEYCKDNCIVYDLKQRIKNWD